MSLGGWLHADVTDFPRFARLKRRATGNDALACPFELCGNLADIQPPTYPVPATELLDRILTIALAEPRTVRRELKSASADCQFRMEFQQASAFFRFPDIIAIEIIPSGPDSSTIALWSRSVVGRKDFGINRARVERWLNRLSSAN